MRLRSILWVPVALLLFAVPSSAGPVIYEYTGIGFDGTALTGGFVLDDAAAWDSTSQQFGNTGLTVVTGVLSSPIQNLWGTYGDYTFAGDVSVESQDQPTMPFPNDTTVDYWIARGQTLSGPAVGGLTPMLLNLFVWSDGSGINGLSLTPPSAIGGSRTFALGFEDAQGVWQEDASGRLTSLTRVPEPATLTLLGLGAAALVRRRRRP